MKHLYLILPLLLFISACGKAAELPSYIDEGEGHLVRLEKVFPKPSYSHPVNIEEGVLEEVLSSIVVSHPVPFLKRLFVQKSEIRGSAFSPEEAALLANQFRTALARATPEERIAFLFTFRKNSMTTELTSGIAFVEGGKFHLVLANHRTPVSTDRHPWIPRDNTLRMYQPEAFELIAQPFQKRMEAGSLERGQEGIIIDYEALAADAKPVSAEAQDGALPALSEGFQLEERLQLLKKFRDESLITEEEYKEKKRELLKSLDLK